MFPLFLLICLFYALHVETKVIPSVNQTVTATTRNAPIQSFTNTSSSSPFSFSYIIPYDQPQECDIYGPICQTGSITVGVSLATANTTTILPCSSYLTEQSTYLYTPDQGPQFYDDDTPSDWLVSFGHSPQCRSYAAEYGNGLYTISGCGDQNTVVGNQNDGSWPTQIPPPLLRRIDPYYTALCCGACSLIASEVRLYYFPDSGTPNCQHNQTSNSSSILSSQNLEKRVHSLINNGSIAATNGYTFTSPSVYLEIVGTAVISDECTATVGPILTNPIMSFPPGVLSSWKPAPASDYPPYETFAVGDVWDDPIIDPFAPYPSAALAIKDLACPTWGLGTNTSADGTVITTIGPPWLPLIIPPIQMFTLNPTWASICTAILTDQLALVTFALFDPPIALTPGLGLVPQPVPSVVAPTSLPASNVADATTVQDTAVAPSIAVAKPASSPADPAGSPTRTGDPVGSSPSSLLPSSGGQARPASPHEGSLASPTNKGDAPAESRAPQPVASVFSAGGVNDPLADPGVISSGVASAGPEAPSQPALQSLGAIIYNAFGNSGPDNGGIENGVNTITVPTAGTQEFTIGGGQILSVNPSGAKFEGKTYSVGGPALTLSNNVYTLVPQHRSDNSASSNDDDTAFDNPPPAPNTLTIAGYTVVPNPTGMLIAGSSVFPGGGAITISNTPVSLDPAGILLVGSSSFSLPPRSVFTVGTHTFTAAPTGFILNGATISPGAAAQWVDSTRVSLGLSGVLAIGSSTVLLPTLLFTPTATRVYTVAGQSFTPNPSAFSIAGTTISAGGPAATVAGTIVSLGQSGALAIDGTTISLQTPSPTFSADSLFTVAGQTFTPNPSAFSIAGTVISAGGSAVTIAGTVISLEPSGTLIIGSSTVPLFASQTPSPALMNFDGLSIEAQPSLAIVDGVTISPGAPGVKVDGQNVSLEAGGATLDIGTGRFAIPAATANGSAGVLAFEGGQGRTVKVSMVTVLIFGIGGSLMLLM